MAATQNPVTQPSFRGLFALANRSNNFKLGIDDVNQYGAWNSRQHYFLVRFSHAPFLRWQESFPFRRD
jgi:hypothetical protein